MRRAKSAAQALLARLETSRIAIPVDLQHELTTAAAPAESLNNAISKGLMLLEPMDGSEGVTDSQRRLADRLGTGERRITLEEWTSQQANAKDDRELLRLDKFLGELAGLGIDPSPFSARVAAIEVEPPSRQALVADRLLLDLTSAIKNGRDRARLERDLAERNAELSEMKSAEAAALRVEIEKAIAKSGNNDQELVKRADFLIEAEAVNPHQFPRPSLDGRRVQIVLGASCRTAPGLATSRSTTSKARRSRGSPSPAPPYRRSRRSPDTA